MLSICTHIEMELYAREENYMIKLIIHEETYMSCRFFVFSSNTKRFKHSYLFDSWLVVYNEGHDNGVLK